MTHRTLPFLASLLIFISFDAISQKKDSLKLWEKGVTSSLTIAQVGLKNWIGGGQNSLSINSLQNLFLNLNHPKVTWTNTLDLGFGLLKQGKDPKFYKSNDKIIYESKISRKIFDGMNLSGMIDYRTQFAPGHNYTTDSAGNKISNLISRFMAPGYLVVAPGLEYKKGDIFYVVLSPATTKFTFVLDDSLASIGAFGVTPGHKVRKELGAYLNTGLKTKLAENINVNTRLTLFQDYRKLGHIDVTWEFMMTFKVNKYISTTISSQLFYDDDIKIKRDNGTIGPAVQFKEVLNIGFLYTFGDVKKKDK